MEPYFAEETPPYARNQGTRQDLPPKGEEVGNEYVFGRVESTTSKGSGDVLSVSRILTARQRGQGSATSTITVKGLVRLHWT